MSAKPPICDSVWGHPGGLWARSHPRDALPVPSLTWGVCVDPNNLGQMLWTDLKDMSPSSGDLRRHLGCRNVVKHLQWGENTNVEWRFSGPLGGKKTEIFRLLYLKVTPNSRALQHLLPPHPPSRLNALFWPFFYILYSTMVSCYCWEKRPLQAITAKGLCTLPSVNYC